MWLISIEDILARLKVDSAYILWEFNLAMDVFLTLVAKLIPLYLLIALGVVAVKLLNAQKETIGRLLIYTITPVVVFYGTIKADLSFATLSLPLLFYVICCTIAFIFWKATSHVWKKEDNTHNILGFASGNTNSGYFCLPVALMLFGNEALSPAVLASLGFILYENTLGFYMVARSHHSVRESLLKLAKLPALYAFFLGVILNFFNVEFPATVTTIFDNFKGAYSLLGMMMIGMGLASVTMQSVDMKFMSLAFGAKFIVWPLVILGVVHLDVVYWHLYSDLIHKIMILMATAPLAANTVTFATLFNVQPAKTAVVVFASTMAALVVIPLAVSFLM